MLEITRAFRQRLVPGVILRSVRDMIPQQAVTVGRLLIDTDDPVTCLLEERDDRSPAFRIVPVLALRRALHGNANIGIRNRPAIVLQSDAGGHFCRVDAEDVGGGAVQSDMPEIARLIDEILVVKKQPHGIGGIIACRIDLFVGYESYSRIGIANEVNDLFAHGAGELATMALLKLDRIGKPAQGVAEGADGKLDKHVPIAG